MSFGIPVRNGLGLGLLASTSLATGNIGGATPPFSPAVLFASGEPGGWYDPSDLTTLFQDSAGTTPVTAVEQPVGLMLDKSGRGNHLTQSTSTARPVLSARVNLLTQTEAFNEAVWGKGGATVTANAVAAPDGTTTADLVVENTAATFHALDVVSLSIAAGSYSLSCCVKAALGTRYLQLGVFGGSGVLASATFNFASGTASTQNGASSGTVNSTSVTNLGDGWYRCTINFTMVATITQVRIGLSNTTSGATTNFLNIAYTGDGTSGIYVWGADLRVANDTAAPVYQRVGVGTPGSSTAAGSSDYTVTGFPLYLRFDGNDDFMVSPTITPGIDKAQVFAGVRKLGTSPAVALELSTGTTNSGMFLLAAPSGTGANSYGFVSRGTSTAEAFAGTSYATPISNVLTGLGNITNDISILRTNGLQAAFSSADQGTGNYLAYPFYVGARAGTSLFFNGRLYPLIVRFGATLTDTQIAQTESYVSTQMGGGYVPVGYDFLVDANGDQLTDASGNALYTIPLYS